MYLSDNALEAQPCQGLSEAQKGQQRAGGRVAVGHLHRSLLLPHLRIQRRDEDCVPHAVSGSALPGTDVHECQITQHCSAAYVLRV